MPPALELAASWSCALGHLARVARCYAYPAYRTHTLISKLRALTGEDGAVQASEKQRRELKELRNLLCYWMALLASLALEAALRAFLSFIPFLGPLSQAYFFWLATPGWENARFMYYGLLGPLASDFDKKLEALGGKLPLGSLHKHIATGARDLAEQARSLAPKVSGSTSFTSLPV